MYERFDQNPDEEFDHFLAEKLGWQSVDLMRRRMSAHEWQRWSVYYQRKAQHRQLAMERAKG